MTSKADTEDARGGAQRPQQRFRHSRKLGLLRSLVINMVLIAIPLAIYFVVVVQHSSAYTDQRSLRALQEVATQIDNKLDSLENILVYGRTDGKGPDSAQSAFVSICADGNGDNCVDNADMQRAQTACGAPEGEGDGVAMAVAMGPEPRLLMRKCGHGPEAQDTATSSRVVGATFSEMIEDTTALAETPLIIVVSQNGDVYAQLVRNHDKDNNPPAHAEVREEPTVANLQAILAAAERHTLIEVQGDDGGGKANDAKRGGDVAKQAAQDAYDGKAADGGEILPGLPVSLDTHIAGSPYRAYVLPYPLRVPISTGTACKKRDPPDDVRGDATCHHEERTIYLVGLRKSGVLTTATESLSPVLLLGALLSLLSACLLWPFARHALLEPNDAVTWRQVRIVGVAFLMVTSVAVVASRASVLGYLMFQKMDNATEVIAREIDGRLQDRIRTELLALASMKRVLTDIPSANACLLNVPRATPEIPVGAAMSAFFEADENGVIGSGCHTYDKLSDTWLPRQSELNVASRAYFSLLKAGHGVVVEGIREPFILQRLFNKKDGKKILQLAVVRHVAENGFSGISSIDVGPIEIASPVLPLGIGYAIFERSTGTVVFHSDDSRSLVENVYAETEHNPTLSTAATYATTAGVHFDGRYRGANVSAYYHTMKYSPWGLVVFYESSSVSAVVALSVVSALVATFLVMLIGLVAVQLVMWASNRRYSWLWPQWRLRNAYPTVGAYLAIIAVGEFFILRRAQSGTWQGVVLVTAPLLVLTACVGSLSARTPEFTVTRPSFLRGGINLIEWTILLHYIILLTWLCAAIASEQFLVSGLLVVAFGAWYALLDRKYALNNRNAWRCDLNLLPSKLLRSKLSARKLSPATGRAAYRIRFLLFVGSIALVISGAPSLAIFERAFEWYLSSALRIARTQTNEQWEVRKQIIEDASGGKGSFRPSSFTPGAAASLGGFGVTVLPPSGVSDPMKRPSPSDPVIFDVDGKALFRVASPTRCFLPPVAWPLGAWDDTMRWSQPLLERLRQEATLIETAGTLADHAMQVVPWCGGESTVSNLETVEKTTPTLVFWRVIPWCLSFVILVLLLNFVARRVAGIAIPWSGRFGRECQPSEQEPDSTAPPANVEPPAHVLLLQPNAGSFEYLRAHVPGPVCDIDAAGYQFKTFRPDPQRARTWAFHRLDIAILDAPRRAALLVLLERLMSDPDNHVVAMGDVSPIFRIARPQAYPGPSWPRIEDSERLRWIDLFSRFYKVYSIEDMRAVFEASASPPGENAVPLTNRTRNLREFIFREVRALWPCLRPVRQILLSRLMADNRITDRDIVEIVALHGEVHYRRAWEYSTRDERLALYHLAQGRLINMSNERVLEHLLRRGLVVFEPEPRIKSMSLRNFILNAELPGRMESYAEEAAEGIWQSLRVPFFVALMLVVAWLAYSSGDAFQAVVALVATSVAVIGQALRLLGIAGISTAANDK